MAENSLEKRIILTGPESTGKSFLTKVLAADFNGVAIEEYARDYMALKNSIYTYDDIDNIANYQYKCWLDSKKVSGFVFFDTHLIITKVWFKWVYGSYPPWIDKAIEETKAAMYLLCNFDLPWEPDSLRENGGEAREELFCRYKEELEKFKLNYHIIQGTGKNRIANAKSVILKYYKEES